MKCLKKPSAKTTEKWVRANIEALTEMPQDLTFWGQYTQLDPMNELEVEILSATITQRVTLSNDVRSFCYAR